jgi:hypothetical protein
MSIARLEKEPPSCSSTEDKVCIGIALVGEGIHVAARAGGREVAHGSFPAGPLGTVRLRGRARIIFPASQWPIGRSCNTPPVTRNPPSFQKWRAGMHNLPAA